MLKFISVCLLPSDWPSRPINISHTHSIAQKGVCKFQGLFPCYNIIFYLQGLPSQISLITSQYQDVSIVLSLGNLCYCEIKLYFLLKCLPGPFFLLSIPINSRPLLLREKALWFKVLIKGFIV